jgi:hypothetical protein
MAIPLRLRIRFENIVNGGIVWIGSNPNSEIGGSEGGEARRRMRPSLLGSRNTISVIWPLSGSMKSKMNYSSVKLESSGLETVTCSYFHPPWRPPRVSRVRRTFVPDGQLTLGLNFEDHQVCGERIMWRVHTWSNPVIPKCITGCFPSPSNSM